MKKAICLLLVALSASSLAFGQTQTENSSSCKLTFNQLPSIRGLKLGITVEELATLLYADPGKLQIDSIFDKTKKYPFYGKASLAFSKSGSRSTWWVTPAISDEKFPGIDSISADFFDKKIIQFTIRYSSVDRDQNTPVWNNVGELIGVLSKNYQLPSLPSWKIHDTHYATLPCSGFNLSVWAGMTDNAATQIELKLLEDFDLIAQQRREEEMRKRREAFKP